MARFEKGQLSRGELNGLIEPEILDKLVNDQYETEEIPATKLLLSQRFDLAFKILFLEQQKHNPDYGTAVYLAHIKAFSFGTFTEPNNEQKRSKGKFVDTFINLSQNISEHGFDSARSLLPLSKSGFIRNGAHRLSASIFANKNVYTITTEDAGRNYDYRFFYERAVSPEYMDAAATTFAEWGENLFIALLWPSARGKDAEVEKAIGNIVYRKQIPLTIDGAHNLMPQVYPSEKWIGNVANNFSGSLNKVVECFNNDGPLRAYLFQADSLEDVLAIKENVRQIFNVGKHSIHITDTRAEVLKLSKILFNNNSIHFLNNAKPNTFLDFHEKLGRFQQFIAKNIIAPEDIAIDTSMILSAYGIRKSADIDYIVNDKYIVTEEFEGINSHNDELHFHEKTAADLLYDPANYFYFNGIKFLSFHQLLAFKKARGGEKDKIDLSIMEAIANNDPGKLAKGRLKQKIYYYKHKLRYLPVIAVIKVLKKIGLYQSIRTKYHHFKSKKR